MKSTSKTADRGAGVWGLARLAAALAVVGAVVGLGSTRAGAAGLLIAEGGFGGALEIESHEVRAAISNGIAVTEIEQVFRNKENRVVEALYTFPVPKDASVSGFTMWIGGKEMVGEVVEKERARQIYESYKQTRRDPGLLEQVDYKRFEMRIFPIAPGAEQRVRVSYYQELDFDDDWATYVYPLATVTRRDADARTRGKFGLSLEVKSEVPIVEMASPSHPDEFAIAKHAPDYWQASLEATGGDLSRDLVVAYRIERPRTGLDLAASKQSGEDGYFLLTLTAGKELDSLEKGMDYVFVLDVSGSMAHDGKLPMSRESLGAFVDALGSEDRFELIAFNVAANALFGKLEAAGDDAKQAAKAFLAAQQARGGTVLQPAIRAAYRHATSDRPLNVVVLSDGMTEAAARGELLALIRERPAGARVFSVGVGNEVNRPLLAELAEETGGLAAFISRGDDFRRQAQAFRRKLLRPAAADVRIEVSGGDVYEVEPKKLPNLYHGSPVRMYGRYKKGGPARVAIHGSVLGKPLEQTVEIELPERAEGSPEIERMWAWRRVERLSREARDGGKSGGAADEIVRLCEGYSIASEYASFIVLENDAEYQRWQIQRRNAARFERDRKARLALARELEALRRKVAEGVGPAEAAAPREVASARAASAAAAPVSPAGPAPAREQAAPQEARRRGWDLDLPLGGGGALDPASAAAAAALAGLAALGARARRRGRGRDAGAEAP
ncbi:MAG: VWA domain-containing protein [Planctomycetes bacterium]|nr:VWA domain-containing protein [Planctomycetota bacterium]